MIRSCIGEISMGVGLACCLVGLVFDSGSVRALS